MKPLFFLNFRSFFEVQLAIIFIGVSCIAYLVYKIWQKR